MCGSCYVIMQLNLSFGRDSNQSNIKKNDY